MMIGSGLDNQPIDIAAEERCRDEIPKPKRRKNPEEMHFLKGTLLWTKS
jgi:hypothetical protein